MKRSLLAAALLALVAAGTARAAAPDANQAAIRGCIVAAASVYRLPPVMLVILLNVEGGSLGRVSHNTNHTVDIGPMQVNQIWLPAIAAHWHATLPRHVPRAARQFLRQCRGGSVDSSPGSRRGAWRFLARRRRLPLARSRLPARLSAVRADAGAAPAGTRRQRRHSARVSRSLAPASTVLAQGN